VAVDVQDLPHTLCRQSLLEAMLDQAGLGGNILGCILGENLDTGKALIYLTDRSAAQKCAAHFHGCSWGSAGPSVTAQVVDAPAGQNLQANNCGNNGHDVQVAQRQGGTAQRSRKMRNGKIPSPKMAGYGAQLPYAAVQPGTGYFADDCLAFKNDSTSDDRELVSSAMSSQASWDTNASGFCACDTDDGF